MKILNLKKIGHPSVKAKFDIEFDIGIISDFSLVHSKGRTFIGMPYIKYMEKGETRYKFIFKPPDKKKEEFQKKVLHILEPFLKSN